ncbi:AAA family ATPase [Gammaproteobacteria bacterium]|nr:AAA family ATPase [Gammaproteobacteria bacterium]
MIFEKCDWLVKEFNSINFNNLPHGIIINGPKGVGKNLLAKKISEKIISNFQENLNINQQNLVDKNNHPDLYLLDKDKYLLKDIRRQKKDSKNWDVEKGFNDVVSFLTLTPSISKNKVVCMINADTMNNIAQNALLKSLEEPAPFSYIIMTTSRSKALNQTIYSRCQVINIPFLSPNKIDNWLLNNGINDYSSLDFPSFATPFSILDDIQSDNQNCYKEFISILIDFISQKIDQSQAIKLLNDIDISFISKINYFVEFYKILLKARILEQDLSGIYKVFNSKNFNKLKISNLINDINNLRDDLYDVTSINETHVLNYFFSELKLSIRQ